jgi:hypothetical protein
MPYPQRDNRERPLTTWSFVERFPIEEQRTPTAPPSPGRRSVTDPTNGGRVPLHNPSAQHTGGLRRRGTFKAGLRRFTPSGRKTNKRLGKQSQVNDMSLQDPALERNQSKPLRPTSDLSLIMAPRRTPPARFAALHNQQTAPIPPHLSTATARTNTRGLNQFHQPVRNDALMTIASRDCSCE